MYTDKIIIVGGLPRTGKSLLRDALGSHSQVAFTPTGLNFFYLFSEKKYKTRGEFDQNLKYFLTKNWIAKKWGLDKILTDITGQSRKDLYLSILELYRKKYWPNKKYIGTYIHNSEEYFNVLLNWFGYNKLKFIQIIRDPFDNYSSYVISRKVDNKLRSPKIYNSVVNKFCNMWAQSAAIGLNGTVRYPDSYRTIFFEDLKDNPEYHFDSLCDWIGIPYEKERMLNFVDFPNKQNSAFPIKRNGVNRLNKDDFDRKSLLSDYEIRTIETMACTNLLNAMDYRSADVIINWKTKNEKNINVIGYSKMVSAVKKSLISTLNLKQALLFYIRELFIFDNIKNILSVITYFVSDKIKK